MAGLPKSFHVMLWAHAMHCCLSCCRQLFHERSYCFDICYFTNPTENKWTCLAMFSISYLCVHLREFYTSYRNRGTWDAHWSCFSLHHCWSVERLFGSATFSFLHQPVFNVDFLPSQAWAGSEHSVYECVGSVCSQHYMEESVRARRNQAWWNWLKARTLY